MKVDDASPVCLFPKTNVEGSLYKDVSKVADIPCHRIDINGASSPFGPDDRNPIQNDGAMGGDEKPILGRLFEDYCQIPELNCRRWTPLLSVPEGHSITSIDKVSGGASVRGDFLPILGQVHIPPLATNDEVSSPRDDNPLLP